MDINRFRNGIALSNPTLWSYLLLSDGLSGDDRSWIINNFNPETEQITIKKANWDELTDDEKMQHLYKWLRFIMRVNNCNSINGLSHITYEMESFFTNLPNGTPIIFEGNVTLFNGNTVPLTLHWNRLWNDDSFFADFGHYGTPTSGQEKLVFGSSTMNAGPHEGVLTFYFQENHAGDLIDDFDDRDCP